MILFTAWLTITVLALLALMWVATEIKVPNNRGNGETTLNGNSVNWIAGIAVTTAIFLCCLAT